MEIKKAVSLKDLKEILKIQSENLYTNISSEEKESEGFVTVCHSYEQIKSLNDKEQHVIAKDQHMVVGYALAMTEASKADIPVLVPMFEVFNDLVFKNKKISESKYIVIGQVCVAKAFRSQGIFDKMYAKYFEFYAEKYDFAITEIASSNIRSRKAHARVGFKEILFFTDSNLIDWVIVVWDWKNQTFIL
jgi:predicted GNAT family N-acyltransferase